MSARRREAGTTDRAAGGARVRLSVVVPMLDEVATVAGAIAAAAEADEIIAVDGGSSDASIATAAGAGARVLRSARGRGTQLACGAAAASGEVLLFVHADTLLPVGFRDEVLRVMEEGAAWGRFDVRFDSGSWLVHAIARLISWRSRLTRGATGDQAMFVRRDVFLAVGGFREAELFEDVDLSRRLKRRGRMGIPRRPVVTSARRWRRHGAVRTSLRMWTLKLLYLAGVPASRLARHYPHAR